MDPTLQHSEEGEPRVGDLLVGAEAIRAFLVVLGMPEKVDPYYLRRQRSWPIGKTAEGKGASLIASKRRLARHADRLTRGSA